MTIIDYLVFQFDTPEAPREAYCITFKQYQHLICNLEEVLYGSEAFYFVLNP